MDSGSIRRRMTAADREQQMLRAAVTAFARGGYAGTTTHQVAAAADVSQPYVLRRFGTKQALFLATYRHACSCIEDAFRAAAATLPPGTDATTAMWTLGAAYAELATRDDLLLLMQHGFMSAGDPALGPAMRRSLADVFALIRELTGADAAQARDFLARGMLVNTLVALRMPEHANETAAGAELVSVTLTLDPRPDPSITE